jgi:predicted N-acetyltransferase YhbS
LARLAVDERAQGRGIGNALLRHVLVLAQHMSVRVGCAGVVVDAKPDAISFYAKLGFVALDAVAGLLGDRPEPSPMYLPLNLLQG